jgi:hypothetical protein
MRTGQWLCSRANIDAAIARSALPVPEFLKPNLSQVRPDALLNAFATPVAMHLVAENAVFSFTIGFASARFLFFQVKEDQAATVLVVSAGDTVSLI